VSDRHVHILLNVLGLPLRNMQNIILACMSYLKKKANQKQTVKY